MRQPGLDVGVVSFNVPADILTLIIVLESKGTMQIDILGPPRDLPGPPLEPLQSFRRNRRILFSSSVLLVRSRYNPRTFWELPH